MCKYCSTLRDNEAILHITEKYTDDWIGVDITDNILYVVVSKNNYYESNYKSIYEEITIDINYCPMCGDKINK